MITSLICAILVVYATLYILTVIVGTIVWHILGVVGFIAHLLNIVPSCTLEEVALVISSPRDKKIFPITHPRTDGTLSLRELLKDESLRELVALSQGFGTLYIKVYYSTIMTKPVLFAGCLSIDWPVRTRYCYFMRFSTITDDIVFPPYSPFDRNIYPSRLDRAILQLQYRESGLILRQYSCNVTKELEMLAGPRQDFFSGTGIIGNQLQPALVFLLLDEHVHRLLQKLGSQVGSSFMLSSGASLKHRIQRPSNELVVKLRCDSTIAPKSFTIDLRSFVPPASMASAIIG